MFERRYISMQRRLSCGPEYYSPKHLAILYTG
jgi:hypothetical protein